MPKKWISPKPRQCDVCSADIEEDWYFVDGNTQLRDPLGPWGIMCPTCHNKHGCGFGQGRGQAYDSETLLKIEDTEGM